MRNAPAQILKCEAPSTQRHAVARTAQVWAAVNSVTDPEIPVISIVDMGMVPSIRIEEGAVTVRMTPTFAGCPALDTIRENIRKAVEAAGFDKVSVETVFDPPWTTDRISDAGRRRLKEFGLAPPGRACGSINESMIAAASCPYCDSNNTILESIFGPTLCRAIHYCNSCRQSFEQFKPV